jgi:crotonobetainyl-CoA:carnitine CoA-transferase CaiB-like acyl-CoA transferase
MVGQDIDTLVRDCEIAFDRWTSDPTEANYERYVTKLDLLDAMIADAKAHNVTRAPWQRQFQRSPIPGKPIETISAIAIGWFIVFLALPTAVILIHDAVSWLRWWMR